MFKKIKVDILYVIHYFAIEYNFSETVLEIFVLVKICMYRWRG